MPRSNLKRVVVQFDPIERFWKVSSAPPLVQRPATLTPFGEFCRNVLSAQNAFQRLADQMEPWHVRDRRERLERLSDDFQAYVLSCSQNVA